MLYTEIKNHEAFDWFKALVDPNNISPKEWDDMSIRSKNWVTCAVGNQCDIIPRDECGCPLDPVLEQQGIFFMGAISRKDAVKALDILVTIEERSTELIRSFS